MINRIAIASIALFATLAAAGCGAQPEAVERNGASAPGDQREPAPTASERLANQIRDGSNETGQASDSVKEVAESLKALAEAETAQRKEQLEEAVAFVDQALAAIAKQAMTVPSHEAVAANFSQFESKRLLAVTTLNDANHELREARGLIVDLIDVKRNLGLTAALELLDASIADVEDAILAYGGQIEKPESATR